MNARTAWRWPLKSRGRLVAVVLAALALALITKTILANGGSTTSPAGAAGALATPVSSTAATKPTAVPTNPAECVALWVKGPDRDACLYRSTALRRPTTRAGTQRPGRRPPLS